MVHFIAVVHTWASAGACPSNYGFNDCQRAAVLEQKVPARKSCLCHFPHAHKPCLYAHSVHARHHQMDGTQSGRPTCTFTHMQTKWQTRHTPGAHANKTANKPHVRRLCCSSTPSGAPTPMLMNHGHLFGTAPSVCVDANRTHLCKHSPCPLPCTSNATTRTMCARYNRTHMHTRMRTIAHC